MGRYFGTDGVRGIAGKDLTATMAYRIGRFLGCYGGKSRRVVLARDTRLSGEMLKCGLSSGLSASGAEVFDLGVSTTPSVSYLTPLGNFDFGIMVSASHNPYMDNGIKVFAPTGEKLDEDTEKEIEAYIDSPEDYLPLMTGSEIGHVHYAKELKDDYWQFLKERAPHPHDVKVIVDLSNGSCTDMVPSLFRDIGLDADYIGNKPDGTNINAGVGATHLEALQKAFKEGHYDLGFSYDGDGDRFIGINHEGRIVDGDALIYLLSLKMKEEGSLVDDTAVLTVMSNFGLRKAMEKAEISTKTVNVGDRNVQIEMKRGGYTIGGEQSGHVIIGTDLNTGDGILSSLRFLDLYLNHRDIYDRLDEFAVYPQILHNLRFQSRPEMEALLSKPSVKQAVAGAETLLGKEGRLLVRTSGTETLVRVMAEHSSESTALQAVAMVEEALGGN